MNELAKLKQQLMFSCQSWRRVAEQLNRNGAKDHAASIMAVVENIEALIASTKPKQ